MKEISAPMFLSAIHMRWLDTKSLDAEDCSTLRVPRVAAEVKRKVQ